MSVPEGQRGKGKFTVLTKANQVPGLHAQADEHRKSYPDNRSEQCQAGAKEAPAHGRSGEEGPDDQKEG